jgi:hypothetical protein
VKTRIALALCTTLALAACTSTPASDADAASSDAASTETPTAEAPASAAPPSASTTAMPPTLANECDANAAQQFVGKKISDDIVEQARIAAGATIARALRPDMMITMEYRGDRLNLATDTNEMVVRVTCG